MSVEENKALVRRFQEIDWSDWQAFLECVNEDYMTYTGSEGRWSARGLREMKQFSPEFVEQHPTASVLVDDIIGEGDKVAIRMTYTEEGGPTANVMGFCRIADGKIVEDWLCPTDIEQ